MAQLVAGGSGGDSDDGATARSVHSQVVTSPSRQLPLKALSRVVFREFDADEEIPEEDLVLAFHEIDCDMTGFIDLEELLSALRRVGLAADQGATETIFKQIDTNLSGNVDLPEFVDFFRNVEDMKRFQAGRQKHRRFATVMVHCTFVMNLTIVCALLMLMVRADPDGDDYALIEGSFMLLMVSLLVLFLPVIGIPVMKFACGPCVTKCCHSCFDRFLDVAPARLSSRLQSRRSWAQPVKVRDEAPAANNDLRSAAHDRHDGSLELVDVDAAPPLLDHPPRTPPKPLQADVDAQASKAQASKPRLLRAFRWGETEEAPVGYSPYSYAEAAEKQESDLLQRTGRSFGKMNGATNRPLRDDQSSPSSPASRGGLSSAGLSGTSPAGLSGTSPAHLMIANVGWPLPGALPSSPSGGRARTA